MSAKVSGRELRMLADRASAAGQEPLSMALHDAARSRELEEHAEELKQRERDFLGGVFSPRTA